MYIKKEIHSKEYTYIKRNLSGFAFYDNKFRTKVLKPLGINEVALSESIQDSHIAFVLEIKINFAVLLRGNNDIGIATYNELKKHDYVGTLNAIFVRDIGINTKLNEFCLDEIHYAYDYITPYAEEILLLLHRSRPLPKYFTMGNYPKRESYYAYSESVVINFYSKLLEIKDRAAKGKCVTGHMMVAAKNILRFEVQCKKDKIKRLKNKYGFDSRNPEYYIDHSIAFGVIEEYLSAVIYEHDFLSFRNVCKDIRRSTAIKSIKTKNKLMYTVSIIGKSGGVEQAKERFVGKTFSVRRNNKRVSFGGCANSIGAYIKKIEQIGVNPVAIPQTWNIKRIENPLYRIIKDK